MTLGEMPISHWRQCAPSFITRLSSHLQSVHCAEHASIDRSTSRSSSRPNNPEQAGVGIATGAGGYDA